jgi:hypothetical protein
MGCSNVGAVDDSISLLLTLNDSTRLLYSPVPYTNPVPGQYLFDVGMLHAGDYSSITLMVGIGCDTIGTPYCFSLDAQSTFATHCLGYNGHGSACRNIGVPFDPNAMYVSSTNHMAIGPVKHLDTEGDDDLTYTCTFQNTGTAAAHNVKLQIPLSDRIDPYTLAPSIASAQYSWLVLNNNLTVDFYNINLPDSAHNESGSHGYFTFHVKQKAGNVFGDSILHNTAIYFDQNAPVTTNTALVTFIKDSTTTAVDGLGELKAVLFPNPANDKVEVIAEGATGIKVADITGRVILERKVTDSRTTLNIAQWQNGLYFVTVSSAKAEKVLKLIKAER